MHVLYLLLQEEELKSIIDKQNKELEVWDETCYISNIVYLSKFFPLRLIVGMLNHPVLQDRVRDVRTLDTGFEVAKAS